MKYDVNFSCGHTASVDLSGKSADRERKIKWYEDCGECPACYKKRMEEEQQSAEQSEQTQITEENAVTTTEEQIPVCVIEQINKEEQEECSQSETKNLET